MKIERFEEIEGWNLARELTRDIYSATKVTGFAHDHGLRDQIRRATGSIMHNIAEGFDAGTNPEFVRFLRYAQRSCSEVQSQLYVALDQTYIEQRRFGELYRMSVRTKSKIGGFIAYLRRNDGPKGPETKTSLESGTFRDEPRTKHIAPEHPGWPTKNQEP